MVADLLDTLEALAKPGPSHTGATVMGDLLARAAFSARPDGYGSGSSVTGALLNQPTSNGALRTHLYDPMPSHHEHGFVDDTSVEQAALDRMHDVCDDCNGAGTVIAHTGEVPRPCRRCNGTGRRWADPTAEAVRDIVAALTDMRRLAAIVDRKRQMVMHARDAVKGRESALGGNCRRCAAWASGAVGDQLKNGWCPDCQLAWGVWQLENKPSGDPVADRRRFDEQYRQGKVEVK
jgi:hypothetical protein